MLNITHYQSYANQNRNEVTSHTSQNGYYQKVQTIDAGRGCWRKGNPLVLLVGMKTSTATMENNVEIP